ncbi:MAG: transposase [Armatimonadetes bacterium]|nr:transposase [Armatimonadota bacterium]
MPRPLRIVPGGVAYHVLNRANLGLPLFTEPADYEGFEAVLGRALERRPMRLLSYCVMPNHWHLVLWPEEDGALSSWVAWLTKTHTQRWHTAHGTTGSGHLYQGRFRSFPVQHDDHLLSVCRYVEHNPLRAGLVERPQDWRWSSLWRRSQGSDAGLTPWPVAAPEDQLAWLNTPPTEAELTALRQCAQRGQPYGQPDWTADMAARLGLDVTFRSRGRPRREPKSS